MHMHADRQRIDARAGLSLAYFSSFDPLLVRMRVRVNWKIFYSTRNTHAHAWQSKWRKEANDNPALRQLYIACLRT